MALALHLKYQSGRLLALVIATSALSVLAVGRVQGQESSPWSYNEARTTATDAADQIAAIYVGKEIADRMALAIRSSAASGKFDDALNGEEFAEQLLATMRAVYDDKHLAVHFHPSGAPESEPPLENDGSGPLSDAAIEWGRFVNGGAERAERLAGNIGYLSIKGLPDAEGGASRGLAAVRFVQETDALILDLRDCGGGAQSMAAVYQSALTDGSETEYGRFEWRSGAQPRRLRTPEVSPSDRYIASKPIVVLIAPGTISACEELAFTLAERERVTLVGEATAGAANPGRFVRAGSRFAIFLPTGRYVSAFDGGNWEGVGVSPDIVAPNDDALEVAHRLALEWVDDVSRRIPFKHFIEHEIQAAGLGNDME